MRIANNSNTLVFARVGYYATLQFAGD